MKASINTLGHVLYAPSQYVIPVFQRNYRWDRPQWDKLWSSLEDLQHPEKTGNHFMGFLVFVQGGVVQPGQNVRYHLIDGQQRLTTTSMLLAAVRNVAQRAGDADLAREVHDYYLVHPLKKGEHRFRLLPKAADSDAFTALIEGKPVPAGRMAEALSYFEAQLERLSGGKPDSLRRVFDTICQRLEFMCATLESENAYNIFKSLNSTGVPLGQSDLIRNFVFMHVHPDQQDAFESEHWSRLERLFADTNGRLDEARFSRFFRDVLMADGQYVQPNDTFYKFETRYEATGFDPVAVSDRLTRFAEHYIVISGEREDPDAGVAAAIAGLNALDSSTTYPLLLRLFDARDIGKLDSLMLAKAIWMLRDFILRRLVCGESSRGYGQMFVRAPTATEDANLVGTLETYLLARGWPHDNRFFESFTTFPFYKSGHSRAVLEELERARGHKEPASLKLAQVEHVMPQTLSAAWVDDLGDEADRVHDEWLHCVGNLTLSAYNQELGNQPFSSKRNRFATSNIGLTRELAALTQWTETEIVARGQRLARDAVTLWKGPAQPHASEEVAVQLQETRAVRLEFWSAFRDYLTERHPAVPELEPTQRRAIRLRSGVRHLSLELRYKVQEDTVAIDLYFHRRALDLWERLKSAPQEMEAMIGEPWNYGQAPKGPYAWATINRSVPSNDPAHWATLHSWLGQKLEQIHTQVLPYLLGELGPSPASGSIANDDSDDDIDADADDRSQAPSEVRQRQRRFWATVGDAIRSRSETVRPQKPLLQHWTNIAVGRTGFFISLTVKNRDDRLGVEFFIGTENAKEQFRTLLTRRAEIESALGFPVEWDELPNRVSSRIACWLDESPLEAESRWVEYANWMADRVIRMDEVFRPLVRQLP